MIPFTVPEPSSLWQDVVERTGWVLIHSLWQYLFVAAVMAVITRSMQRGSARSRYCVLVIAMASCVAVPLVTWRLLPGNALDPQTNRSNSSNRKSSSVLPSDLANLRSGTEHRFPGHAPGIVKTEVATVDRRDTAAPTEENSSKPRQPWVESIGSLLRPWLAWIVAAWFAGVTLFSLRPLIGWQMLRRLRCTGVSAVSHEVQAALARVSLGLGLRRVVTVLQSTLVPAPVVIGYVRPVILLPVSLLTSIPPSQLEAILAHELAHIRRHDFVINLLQTLMETLFFYHPAVWWLSHRIRIEREHCCDDLVVASIGNTLEYGRALLAIAELRGNRSLFALGAADGSLRSRVRRILRVGVDRSADRLNDHALAQS